MRTLAIGDIHGGLKGLTQLIERAQIKADDTLIFLGDYVDGWSESAQVIDYLIHLSQTNKCVFIKGNHDVWCENWLRSGKNELIWLSHGGHETVQSYAGFSDEKKNEHLRFFEAMKLYYIDDDNRLFIHAGFTSISGVKNELNVKNFYFDRTLWEMALSINTKLKVKSKFYPKRLLNYSEIYIGHTPTINYDKKKPMNAANVWNIDTGAAFTGRLSAIDIESKVIFQSKSLVKLYPDELGRNNS